MTSLDAEVVRPLLRGSFGDPYLFEPKCTSTQDLLRDSGLPEGAVAAADHQTRGRGRQGRRWEDAAGEALLLSVLLRPPPTPALPQLSLVVALAVAEATERATLMQTGVKWPNDVLVDGLKVAGILLEASGGTVICGIGINVNQTAERLPRSPRRQAASYRTLTGTQHVRAAVLADLLEAFEARYRTWSTGGLAHLLDELNARNALLGSRVLAQGRPGIAGNIVADGRLRVDLADGKTELVQSGELDVVQ